MNISSYMTSPVVAKSIHTDGNVDTSTEGSVHSLSTGAPGSCCRQGASPLAVPSECGGRFFSILEAAAGRHREEPGHDQLRGVSESWLLCMRAGTIAVD